MCGIAGYVCGSSVASKIQDLDLDQLKASIAHRGPDGSGVADFVTDNAVGSFFHSRLSIVDLSKASSQPIKDTHYGNILTFNGEIYNYRKLAEKFNIPANYRFSDTLVLYYMLSTISLDRVLEAIEGMFAFAFFDEASSKLVLARDRFGEKPLYHSKVNGLADDVFLFSSDLSSFHCHKNKKVELDSETTKQFIDFGFTLDRRTILAGVDEVAAGSCLCINLGYRPSADIYRYFSLDKLGAMPPNNEKTLQSKVINAVNLALTSDVDIGAFLSGGLDSTLVTALASSSKKLRCFTFAADQDDWDLKNARSNAVRLKLPHHHVSLGEVDLEEAIDAYLGNVTEPIGDDSGFFVHLVALAARQENIKVLLGGDAGDEIFFGYSRMNRCLELIKAFKFFNFLKFRKSKKKKSRLGKLWDLNTSSIEEFYINYFLNQSTNTWHYYSKRFDGNASEIIRKIEIDLYLRKNIFTKLDYNTMMHGVEGRTPLANRDLLSAYPLDENVDTDSRRRIFTSILKQQNLDLDFNERKSGFGIKHSWQLFNSLQSKNLNDKRLLNFFKVTAIQQQFNVDSFEVNFRLRSLSKFLAKQESA